MAARRPPRSRKSWLVDWTAIAPACGLHANDTAKPADVLVGKMHDKAGNRMLQAGTGIRKSLLAPHSAASSICFGKLCLPGDFRVASGKVRRASQRAAPAACRRIFLGSLGPLRRSAQSSASSVVSDSSELRACENSNHPQPHCHCFSFSVAVNRQLYQGRFLQLPQAFEQFRSALRSRLLDRPVAKLAGSRASCPANKCFPSSGYQVIE
jgi:hypothetical protein